LKPCVLDFSLIREDSYAHGDREGFEARGAWSGSNYHWAATIMMIGSRRNP
jgi:hypothetical protein